jgi:hypothetical protein
MGEIKEVVNRLSSKLNTLQFINILVVGIPKAYGILLNIGCSSKLNGYFATD